MCKWKLAITLSEEIMIVGRKKDGDGKGNKWNEVNMEILEVSLYRGICGGKLWIYVHVAYESLSRMEHICPWHKVVHELLVSYGRCHAWIYVAYEHIWHMKQCGA